jgi:YggT family protein
MRRNTIARRRAAPEPRGIAPLGALAYMGAEAKRGVETMVLALIGVLMLLLDVVWWVIMIQFVLSLLLIFNVINTHNDFIRSLYSALEKMTEPLYRPIRRLLPDFGGIDFSPMVVLLLIMILDRLLMGAAVSVASGSA